MVLKKRNKLGKKLTNWNPNKEGGWQQFKHLTTNNKVLDYIAKSDVDDPDLLMKRIEREMSTIKHKDFGKVNVQ